VLYILLAVFRKGVGGNLMNNYSVRVFIIEDNFVQRKSIENFVNSYLKDTFSLDVKFPDIGIINDFYEKIASQKFYTSDLFIIDYNLLTYFNGIDVAKKITENHSKAILGFLTAYNDKAIDLINSKTFPVGYALKDPEPEILYSQLSALLQNMLAKLQDLTVKEDCISVPVGNSIRIIPCKDICYLTTQKKERNKVFIQTKKKPTYRKYKLEKNRRFIKYSDRLCILQILYI
jgi:two-component system response regulator AgrA